MRVRLSFVLLILPLTGWGDEGSRWPIAGAMPDQPVGAVGPAYVPIGAGTKSYRPVEPLPWGDINRRVAPLPNKSTPEVPEKQEKR